MFIGGYKKEYQEAYQLLLVGLVVLLVALNERKDMKNE